MRDGPKDPLVTFVKGMGLVPAKRQDADPAGANTKRQKCAPVNLRTLVGFARGRTQEVGYGRIGDKYRRIGVCKHELKGGGLGGLNPTADTIPRRFKWFFMHSRMREAIFPASFSRSMARTSAENCCESVMCYLQKAAYSD